jgi:AGCS family alanine or glycine:cation symporter
MKLKLQTLIALILPLFSFAQDKGIDQIIDEKFGDATGWFVNFIFYQIEFSEDVKVFLGFVSIDFWSCLFYNLF